MKLVGTDSGISIGEDGPSQMAIEDVALARALPNFTVLVPADEPSSRGQRPGHAAAPKAVLPTCAPAVSQLPIVYPKGENITIGKANTLREGKDVTIIACGLMVGAALEAAQELSNAGVSARVLDMHTIKPLDEEAVERAARQTQGIVTAEEHLIEGGLGAAVARAVAVRHPAPMAFVGLNRYAESGEPQELLTKYGLMPADIVKAARRVLG